MLGIGCYTHVESGGIWIERHHAGSSPIVIEPGALFILCFTPTRRTIARWIFPVVRWRLRIYVEWIFWAADVVRDDFPTWIGITLLAGRKVETHREVDRDSVCNNA